jgi:uncharacterized membrane protein YccF (DUF307 family)
MQQSPYPPEQNNQQSVPQWGQPQGYPQQQMYQPPIQQPYNPQQPMYQQPMQQPMQQPYNPQQPMYQQPYNPQQPVPMMNMMVNVNVQQQGPGFLVRALYFCFIGWWAGFFWLNLGFFLCALIITLPVGLIMLNRLPQVMTLKPAGTRTNVNVSTMTMQSPMGPMMQQNVNVNVGGTQQQSFLIRAIYFLLVGWWVGYIWAYIAYACCLLIVLLPVGVMMFDRLPMVLTLRRN